MNQKWGPESSQPGFFPVAGKGAHQHSFGGAGWIVTGVTGDDHPVLLLDLDLADPLLASRIAGASAPQRLPVLSLVNSSAWHPRQEYLFDPPARTVRWLAPEIVSDASAPADRLEAPFPGTQVILAPMRRSDCPVNEDKYWAIGDTFVGGRRFIRIFGSPYWLQHPAVETCPCGAAMPLVVSIGHEALDQPGAFTPAPFFIGEAALYTFVCWPCRRVRLIPQST
jgi:hypothetical protein